MGDPFWQTCVFLDERVSDKKARILRADRREMSIIGRFGARKRLESRGTDLVADGGWNSDDAAGGPAGGDELVVPAVEYDALALALSDLLGVGLVGRGSFAVAKGGALLDAVVASAFSGPEE